MNQNCYPDIHNTIAPAYSAAEEFTNALTHGTGFLISVAALIYMFAIMPADYSLFKQFKDGPMYAPSFQHVIL